MVEKENLFDIGILGYSCGTLGVCQPGILSNNGIPSRIHDMDYVESILLSGARLLSPDDFNIKLCNHPLDSGATYR